jgi:hypothetical protein
LTTKNLQQVTVSIRIFLTSFARLTCQCTKNGTAPLQRRPRNAPAFQKTLLCNCQRAIFKSQFSRHGSGHDIGSDLKTDT